MKRLGVIGPLLVIFGFALMGLILSRTHLHSPALLSEAFAGPTWENLLGRDEEGRDLFLRILAGGFLSVSVAVCVVCLSTFVGLIAGGGAGLFGEAVDHLFVSVTDALLAFPGILLMIAIASFQRDMSFGGMVLILSILGWVGPARLVRGQALALKGRPFVEAAAGLGASRQRLLIRHIVPHLLGPLAVQASFQAAGVILVESTLSFLGIGFGPDTPSWGGLMDQGIQYLLIAPHMVVFPGLALMLVILALTQLGDRLGDYFARGAPPSASSGR